MKTEMYFVCKINRCVVFFHLKPTLGLFIVSRENSQKVLVVKFIFSLVADYHIATLTKPSFAMNVFVGFR